MTQKILSQLLVKYAKTENKIIPAAAASTLENLQQSDTENPFVFGTLSIVDNTSIQAFYDEEIILDNNKKQNAYLLVRTARKPFKMSELVQGGVVRQRTQ